MRTTNIRKRLREIFDTLYCWCEFGAPAPDFYRGEEIRELMDEAHNLACAIGCPVETTPTTCPHAALRYVSQVLTLAAPTPDTLTVQQAADKLGVSPRTVYDLVESGRLKCQRFGKGRGTIRIRPADLERCDTADTGLRHL